MRALINLTVIVSVLLILPACHSKRGWVKYSSNADGFTVFMPAAPKTLVKQEQTAFGKQTVHYIFWKPATFDINKLKLLQVSYYDCPRHSRLDSTQLNAILDSNISHLKQNYTELDLQSERISIEGYPGRAFIFEDEKENSTNIVKAIFANNKIYIITAITKRDYPTNTELNIFFDSFLILR